MSNAPIAHKVIDLYAKINGEKIQAGTLRLPVYAEIEGCAISLRVGPLDTDEQGAKV